ncbi:MAG TPA: AGE family epimerase/isomerase, partial [Candidatus Glassbacteria bacterium]|nr:AGE family epimerase/isomerase [Candidatus Glassbacteria bacterium]
MAALDSAKYLAIFRQELFESVIPFWLDHSIDTKHGGYFNCLDRDGSVYDTTKYLWLQGRMVWMFSYLYNHCEKNGRWLEAAARGVEFIRKYGKTPEGRVYFSLARDGRPVFIQRKPFAELFYSLALDEFSRASGDARLKAEAVETFE